MMNSVMVNCEAISDLLAKKRATEHSLEEISKSLNDLAKPLVMGILANYQAIGGTWPGLEDEKIAAAINSLNGFNFKIYDVRNVLLEMAESKEIMNEQSGHYRLHPFKKYELH